MRNRRHLLRTRSDWEKRRDRVSPDRAATTLKAQPCRYRRSSRSCARWPAKPAWCCFPWAATTSASPTSSPPARNPGNCDPFTAELTDRLDSLARRLPNAYRAVDAVVNGRDALAARDGRAAPIIVLGYPSLVSIQDVGKCPYLSRTDADRGDQLVRRLDGVLADAATAAREGGAPVYFAEDLLDAFRPDHTLCSPDRYVVPINLLGTLDGATKQQMMHPTERGYQALTGALVRWSNREQPEVGARGEAAAVRIENVGEPVAARSDHVRGETVSVRAGGFAPGSPVVLDLRSLPRALATGIAAPDDTVDLVAVLPSDTPTGRHDLVVSGVDDSQRPHRVATTIDIRGTTHWWMHGLLGTAGACVLFTGVSRLNLQRLRRTTEPRQPRAVRR